MVIVDVPWTTRLDLFINDMISIGNWFAEILNL